MQRSFLVRCLATLITVGAALAEEVPIKRVLVPAETIESPAPSSGPIVQMAAFLGVQTDHVSESLAWHLNLAPGFGLIVEEVMPGSPAAKAGIRQHDILLRYENQQLVNMDQLQVLVRSGKNGDAVELQLLSQGKQKVITAILDEGPVQISPPMKAAANVTPANQPTPLDWEWHQHHWKQRVDHFQQQMQTYQQQVDNWVKNGIKEPHHLFPE